MESNSQALPGGYRLGDYIIDRPLGQGGFGITYLAHDPEADTRVVIKENLPKDFAVRDSANFHVVPIDTTRAGVDDYEWALGNFYQEAQLLSCLDHPNIVKVLRAFHSLGTAYYVMPYLGGLSLDGWAERNSSMDRKTLEGLLRPLLSALGYLHAGNLLHRDIKPQNIIMQGDATPVLIDFGAARQIVCDRTATKLASPGYTPFEQLQLHGKTGPWTDLYALGATFYRIITGERPPDSNDRVGNDGGDPLVPLCARPEFVARYGRSMLAGIDKALQKNREQRWQSAAEWIEWLDNLPAEEAEVGLGAAAGAPGDGASRPARKLLAASVAGGLLLAAGIAGYAFIGAEEPPVGGGAVASAMDSPAEDGAGLDDLLLAAARAGDAAEVEALLDKGASADAKGGDADSALHKAVRNGHVDTVRLLLDRGADVHVLDATWRTPLHEAVAEGGAEVAMLLLERGATAGAQDVNGWSPLHQAALSGAADLVAPLLDHGAAVDAANNTGWTPLHFAASAGHTEIVGTLLDHGAAPSLRNKEGKTPLQIAEEAAQREAAAFLRGRGVAE